MDLGRAGRLRQQDGGPRRRGGWLANLLQVAAALVFFAAFLTLFLGDSERDSDVAPTPLATFSADPVDHVRAAERFYSQGRYAEAATEYEVAIELDPTNVDTWLAGAFANIYAGEPEKALDKADTAIVLNDEDARPWAIRALALDWQASYTDAINYADEALERDRNNALAWAVRAKVSIDLGNYDDAQTALGEALRLAPDNIEVIRAQGYVTETIPDPATGLPDFRAAIDSYQRVQAAGMQLGWVSYRIGLNYLVLGDYASAIAAFEEAEALLPDSALPYIGLSRIYIRTQEYDAARAALDEAFARDPSDRNVYGFRGILEYRLDNYDEAFFYLNCAVEGCEYPEQGISLGPAPLGQSTLSYFTDYGLILTERGQCSRGLGFLSAALEYAPSDPNVLQVYNLGIEYCGGIESIETPEPDAAEAEDDS